MTVRMQTVTKPEGLCSICLENFHEKSPEVIGHEIPDSRDKKVYCLVHAACFKRNVAFRQQSLCPTCKRKVAADSVFSLKDLGTESRWYLARKFLCNAGIGVASVLGGAWLARNVVQGDSLTHHVVRALGVTAAATPIIKAASRKTLTNTPKELAIHSALCAFVGSGLGANKSISSKTILLAPVGLVIGHGIGEAFAIHSAFKDMYREIDNN